MKFIGITGGVGAGKSKILHYIEQEYPAKVLYADEIAHEQMQPKTACFQEIKQKFGSEDIFNRIVHPAVKREILRIAKEERKKGKYSYLILEAALLIEEGYDAICDELWFVDTAENIRRKRLREDRGYSDEKIDAIFSSQLSDD